MGIIRLLLAASVLSIHFNPSAGFSNFGEVLAVNAFFIISGFYMSLIINEKYNLKHNSYWTFLTNRFLRIYPIYWIILILTILFNYFLLKSVASGNIFLYRPIFDIISDFTLLIRTDYFNLNAIFGNSPTIIVAWTLVIELTFYVLAPFIVKRKLWIIILLAVLSLLAKYGVAYYEMLRRDYHKPGFFLASLCFFMLGVVSYRIYVRIKNRKIPKKLSVSALLFLIFLIVFWRSIPSIFSYHQFYLKDWGYYFFLTASIPLIFLLFKSNPLESLLGKISYPVYVSHVLVGDFLHHNFGLKTGNLNAFAVIFIATIIFSFLLVRFVDEPIDKYRQNRLKKIK